MSYLTLRTKIAGVDVKWSSKRSSDAYADLAYVTGVANVSPDAAPASLAALRAATDMLTLGFDSWGTDGSFGVSYIHSRRSDRENEIISASYARHLWDHGPSLRVGGYTDLAEGGYGVALNLSMAMGKQSYGGTGLSRSRKGEIISYANLSRPVGRELGSYGYRVNISDRHRGSGLADVAASYRTGVGLGEVRLNRNDRGQISGSASFEGAVVLAGNTLLTGNAIRDGFAVVKVGVPGVPVQVFGRDVARTGIFGAALVPDLQSYRASRVSIDPTTLPPGAGVNATAMMVVPASKSGVTVQFGAGKSTAALLTVTGPDGAVLPAGIPVKLGHGWEEFIMGYDGALWLEGLKAQNTLLATWDRGSCSARFTFAPSGEDVTQIKGVQCK